MGASSPSSSGSARGNHACIAVLVLVIVVQLFAIHSYTSAPQPQVLHDCPMDASGNPIAVGSNDAHSALRVLGKFLREQQATTDVAVSTGSPVKRKPSDPKITEAPNAMHVDMDKVEIAKKDSMTHHEHSHDEGGEAHHHHAGDTHDEEFLKSNPSLYHQIWNNISITWAQDTLDPSRDKSLSQEDRKRIAQCREWGRQPGGVIVDESWGRLTDLASQKEFDSLKCSDVLSEVNTAEFVLEHPDYYDHVLPVPKDRVKPKAELGFEDKVIAVIIPLTTRGLHGINSLNDLSLFKHLFPSFVNFAEPDFEYWMYVAFDVGDPWFDNESHLASAEAWFDTHVGETLKARGITAKLILTKWENSFQRPGPAMNQATGVAFADGATFIYRINDDILFESPWAKDMTETMMSFGPPYGVVGPACGQGATHILVVDMTHRTHHEIFQTHYPPSLMTWFLDNWISQVYGRKRTVRVNSAKIRHLTESHGTRYHIAGSAKYYRGEVVRGRVQFEEYLSHTPGMEKVLEQYRGDSFFYATR